MDSQMKCNLRTTMFALEGAMCHSIADFLSLRTFPLARPSNAPSQSTNPNLQFANSEDSAKFHSFKLRSLRVIDRRARVLRPASAGSKNASRSGRGASRFHSVSSVGT